MVPVDESWPRQNAVVKILAEKRVCGQYGLPFLHRTAAFSPGLRFFFLEHMFIDMVFVWDVGRLNFDLILDLRVSSGFDYPGFPLAREIVLADANVDVEAESLEDPE